MYQLIFLQARQFSTTDSHFFVIICYKILALNLKFKKESERFITENLNKNLKDNNDIFHSRTK